MIQGADRLPHLPSLTFERSVKIRLCRVLRSSFRFAPQLGEVDVRSMCSRYVIFENIHHSSFQETFLGNTLFILNHSTVQQLSTLVGSFNHLKTASCRRCRAFLHRRTSKRLRGSVVVSGKRDSKVVGEESLPTFCTVISDGTIYFNRVSWVILRLRL